MDLIYYRNFRSKSFFGKADFLLSSRFEISVKPVFREEENEMPVVDVSIILVRLEESLHKGDSGVVDAKVIVGENGVGKTSLFQQIREFCGVSAFALKGEVKNDSDDDFDDWKLLLSEHFIVFGNKVRISEENLENLKKVLPELKLIVYGVHPYSVSWQEELSGFRNIYGFLSGKSKCLINYSNSIVPSQSNVRFWELRSTAEIESEPKSIIDISTYDYLIKSPKWNPKSTLNKVMGVDGLLAIDNYQTSEFLDNCFDFVWFEKLIPESIKFKLKVCIKYGYIGERFNSYITSNEVFLNLDQAFPVYYQISRRTQLDGVNHLYREFIYSLMYKAVDDSHDSQRSLKDSIELVLGDFESSIMGEFKPVQETFDFVKMAQTYLSNTKVLTGAEANELLEVFNSLQEVLRGPDIGSFWMSKGIDLVSGILISFQNGSEILKEIYESYSKLRALIKHPFLDFSLERISAGERNFVFFLTRFFRSIHDLNEVPGVQQKFTLLLDEPGNDYHPEWQRKLFHDLKSAIDTYSNSERKISVQILITTHSPFILSDFPELNIIRLVKGFDTDGKQRTLVKGGVENTFGANIYDILADSFFLENGFCGEFAKNVINTVFADLELIS